MNKSISFSVDWTDLTQIVKCLKPVTSRSDTRPLFQGINFRAHSDGRLLATALDGFHQASILRKCVLPPAEYTEFTILPFNIPKPPKCSDPPVAIMVTDDSVQFTFSMLDGTLNITAKKLEGDYLDIPRLLPNSLENPAARVFVNPNYLIDIAKAAINTEKMIELRCYGSTSALMVVRYPDYEALVLPIVGPKTAVDTTRVLYAIKEGAKHD